jgi:hypothetical protein
VDGDERLDIVSANRLGSKVVVMRNNGT